MKKILIANDCLVGGGVENVLENMVRYLMKKEYDITLIIPNCKKEEVENLFGENVKLYPLRRQLKQLKKKSLLWFIDRCMYVIDNIIYHFIFLLHRYDIVIALKEGPTMKEMATLYGKKKYAWVHVDYQYMHWTKNEFESSENEIKCMQKFDKVVCVSESAKESVIKTIGDPGNLCVRYNPIDSIRIRELAKIECTERRCGEHLVFVSVGRLSSEKNYHLLLDVCSELEKKYKFSVWIVGDGPQKNELVEKIKLKSIKSVRLLGNQKNPYPFFKIADVFVSSAKCESFGLAVQEALVLGKPVIAIKCPAIVETLDTKFGLLIDDDYNALYTAMEQIIMNENLLTSFQANIKEYYKTDEMYEKRLQDICSLWE